MEIVFCELNRIIWVFLSFTTIFNQHAIPRYRNKLFLSLTGYSHGSHDNDETIINKLELLRFIVENVAEVDDEEY